MNNITLALQDTAFQLLSIAIPLALVATVLRLLEIVVQRRLARRFGWNVVLVTGWLGTPIHELSHAVMCLVFRHRIVELALFRPDEKSGRLGYVLHSYNPKNAYQVLGNFFIGTAPLVGGTLTMYALLWIFYPSAAAKAMSDSSIGNAIASGQVLAAVGGVIGHGLGVLRGVVDFKNLADFRFWLFLYLMLCIASHMAPSGADYRGSKWGAVLLVVAMLVANFLFLMCGGEAGSMTRLVASVLGLVLGLWVLSILFCAIAALVVLVVTGLFDLAADRR